VFDVVLPDFMGENDSGVVVQVLPEISPWSFATFAAFASAQLVAFDKPACMLEEASEGGLRDVKPAQAKRVAAQSP